MRLWLLAFGCLLLIGCGGPSKGEWYEDISSRTRYMVVDVGIGSELHTHWTLVGETSKPAALVSMSAKDADERCVVFELKNTKGTGRSVFMIMSQTEFKRDFRKVN